MVTLELAKIGLFASSFVFGESALVKGYSECLSVERRIPKEGVCFLLRAFTDASEECQEGRRKVRYRHCSTAVQKGLARYQNRKVNSIRERSSRSPVRIPPITHCGESTAGGAQ